MGIESIIEQYETVKKVVAELEADVLKAANGNNAAGGRVRKALKVVSASARDMRKSTLAFSKAERAAKVVEAAAAPVSE